jgi:hypothetical protein
MTSRNARAAAHELKTERVVHSFELREQPASERNPVGAADAIAA